MTGQPRRFTRAEDELIVRQSRGEMNLKELRYAIRANIKTIDRRAKELGVTLVQQRVFRSPGRKPGTFPNTHDTLTPARIKDDKLLKRLRQVYGDPE